jgi:hypothetical protein
VLFIPQEDNLLIGVVDTPGGTYTGAVFGIMVCGASARIVLIPALLLVVYRGGRLGSQLVEGKNFLFSLIGQYDEDSTVA